MNAIYYECRVCKNVGQLTGPVKRCEKCSSADLTGLTSEEYKAILYVEGKLFVLPKRGKHGT